MFIGHLPAGYLCSQFLLKKFQGLSRRDYRILLATGLVASVFPDFDLLYFYFIDGRQNLHHSYWIHIPFYWVIITGIWAFAALLWKNQIFRLSSLVWGANILVHLILDTIVGKIHWLFPFSKVDVVFFDVTARYDWWVWNFVLHWTFLFEIGLVLGAIYLLYQKSKSRAI